MSNLTEAFSLSQSGGIYFEGARVEGTQTELVLFVGLGGTGSEALIRVKNQIHNRMKLTTRNGMPVGETPSNIAFLALDTDKDDVQKKHYANTHFASDGSETLAIGADGVNYQALIDQLLDEKKMGMKHAQWLADGTLAVGGADGAGGRRTVGRVGFFHQVDNIRSKVQRTLNKLNSDNPGIFNLKIFLFSGIAGGTGSGTFLDMGFLLRDLGQGMHAQCQIFGYLFMPDLNMKDGGKPISLEANGYAALKELDYLMERGRGGRPFIQEYSASYQIQGDVPFDFCHLINATDNKGNVYFKDQVMNAVAESIFTYVANEPNLGAGNATGLKSLYDNVNNYLTIVNTQTNMPANYHYLTAGSASLKVPYLEINTLIACRMFEWMNKEIFANEVTDAKFDADKSALGLGSAKGENTFQDALARLLEAKAPEMAILDKRLYKYDDIWTDKDMAYSAAYKNWQEYQTRMNECFAEAPGVLEDLLRKYLKSAMVDQERGPIYLAKLLSGNDSRNMEKLLRTQADYFRRISAQENDKAKELDDERHRVYKSGASAGGFFGIIEKDKALKEYLEILEIWRTEHLTVDKYSYMAKLAEELADIYHKYYTQILKPLRTILEELVVIFETNLNVLTVEAQKSAQNPDPSILMDPFEFEKQHKSDFDDCVTQAQNNFLSNLLENLQYWIKCDIDNVDKQLVNNPDVQGYLSKFISDCFSSLYTTIDMEKILEKKVPAEMNLLGYTQQLIDKLYDTSYPLFKNNKFVIPKNDSAILSIPVGCPTILAAAQSFVNARGLGGQITIKESAENNCISVIKVTSGYPLYAMQYLDDWENSYESLLQDKESGRYLHMLSEWGNGLPNPDIELGWSGGHICHRTKDRNAELREKFQRCVDAGLIEYPVAGKGAQEANLRVGKALDLSRIQLRGDLVQQQKQLQTLQLQIWNPQSPAKMELTGMGTYAANGTREGYLKNICENCIRDPYVWKALRDQCEMLDAIAVLQDELDSPYFYVRAWLCNMFERTDATKDILLRRSENDVMPIMLIKGSEKPLSTKDDTFYYVIYQEFCKHLKEEASEGLTWSNLIAANCDTRMRETVDSEVKAAVISQLENFGMIFKQYSDNYRRLADTTPISDTVLKEERTSIADFYYAAFQVAANYYRLVND